jgi:hypothetical protein
MVKSYQDLREKTLAMSAFFETSNGYPECYGITSGNHDQQGLSHGVLQFNFGTGSLSPIWNYLNTNYNQMCRDIFGVDYTEWSNVLAMSTVDQVAWGESITDYNRNAEGYKILIKWEDYFQTLGETQPSIDKQVENSQQWLTNALKWYKTLGLWSRRGFALLWDISVQMGRLFPLNLIWNDFKGIDTTGKTRQQIEEEKLYIILNRASFHNRPNQYSQGVYDRKVMILDGTGDWWGTPFNIATFDLDYEPAFEEDIVRGHSITGVTPTKPILEVTNLYNGVRIDWAESEYANSYKIYRTQNIENLGAMLPNGELFDTTTYTDTTVTGGQTYYYTVKAINSYDTINSDKATGLPSTTPMYENKTVDFEGYTSWQVYGATEVNNDFGSYTTLQGGDRLKIDTTGRLRFYLPIGMVGSANTGGIIKANIVPKNEYTLEYEIRFDSGFPWSKGGKVAGLSGGKGYTGGEGNLARTLGDGWSVRMMWREDGRIIPYVYHYGMTEDFGDTFGKTLGYFTNTQAHKIKYYVKLNTGSNQDGILRIWMDDVQILNEEELTYRIDDSKIDTCHISIFAGGSTEDWNMTGDGYIRLSYISWQ